MCSQITLLQNRTADRFNAQMQISVDIQKVRHIPVLKPEETHPDLIQVQNYLRRFGYLPLHADIAAGKLDKPTIEALQKFQDFFGVPKSEGFTEATRVAMSEPRCGMPDYYDLTFHTKGAWNRRFLTYAFGELTSQRIGKDVVKNAVRAALATWQNAVVGLRFLEVKYCQSPDIVIEWKPAKDPDYSMVGDILAHADFPPGFSIITKNLSLPVHFDDTEHTWAVGRDFDIETVSLHEFGHILGLLHEPKVQEAVMFSPYSGIRRNLHADDLNGIRSLYPATILRHGIRNKDGSWNGMNLKGDSVLKVACAAIDSDLHVCAMGHNHQLMHGIRCADGSWNGLNIKGDVVSDVSCAFVEKQLHVCAVGKDGTLWHGIRNQDGSWIGLNRKGDAVKRVACAAIGKELHVCAMGEECRLWHGIRFADGSWDGLNLRGDTVLDVACASIGNELHVCTVGPNRVLWHGIRHKNGKWSGLNRKGDKIIEVDCASIDGNLHVCGTGHDLSLWHGIRLDDGNWIGLNRRDDKVQSVSCAAIGGNLHVCSSSVN